MLIKVKAIIETMVQINDGETSITACEKAKEIVREGNFSCLQFDLKVCVRDDVKLSTIMITSKQKLPSYAEDWYAWKEDGGTTKRTCGEIICVDKSK